MTYAEKTIINIEFDAFDIWNLLEIAKKFNQINPKELGNSQGITAKLATDCVDRINNCANAEIKFSVKGDNIDIKHL